MRSLSAKAWLLVVLSAVLQTLPFPIAGPAPVWRRAFCWFCLVPLLLVVTSTGGRGKIFSLRQVVTLGYLCGLLWYAANCYWIYQTMHIYGGIPEPGALAILVLFAAYLGLYHAAFVVGLGWLARRYSATVAMLLAPFLWVAAELARARITGFPWDLLGYSQVDNFWLTALAPFGGVLVLSFVVAAVNAGLVLVLRLPTRRGQAAGLAGLLALIGILQIGTQRQPRSDAAGHAAVLLQENLAVGREMREVAPISETEKYRQFIKLSLQSLQGSSIRPELVVWPEAPADFATTDPAFRKNLGSLARTAKAPVIAGSIGVDIDPGEGRGYREFGSAAVFSADGRYVGRYDKIHRVPWGEYVPYKDLFFFAGKLVQFVGNMEAGTQHSVFALDGHGVGIFICYESIFGDEVREFVRNGAEVLVNISDDGWYGDTGAPWQHLDMARMRAIENRRWVLRDTNTGVTVAIDPHGRGDFSTPRHVRAAFPVVFGYCSEQTFYTRHGDWFAWLCALVAGAGLVVAGVMPSRRLAGRE